MNEDIGQQWSPPKELMLPTPRPVRRVSWLAAARYMGMQPDVYGAGFLICALLAIPMWFLGNPINNYKLPVAILIIWLTFDVAAFLCAPLFLMGLLLIILPDGYFAVRKAKRSLEWGRPARAVVIDVRYVSSGRVGMRWGTWISTLEYHDYAGNILKGSVHGKLSENQVVTVLYDPDKPKKFIDYPVAGYEIGGPRSS